MKKLALLFLLAGLQLSTSAQTWPIGGWPGWPVSVATGSQWNNPELINGIVNMNYYGNNINLMIYDLLNSTNNFINNPPINNDFGGLNQRQYYFSLAMPMCMKKITETKQFTVNLGATMYPELENSIFVAQTGIQRQKAIIEIMEAIRNDLLAQGIGMDLIDKIFLDGVKTKAKSAISAEVWITYVYWKHLPCDPTENGQSN
ncbi:MAG: hypothetical protein ACK5UE_06795 [Chitinophagales bacterium]|jgi:hypothetical protein|nr:hypothetical protein [Sphingobacteriales bacterium]